ncbi:MAG TPA: tetratricopeptide repeat protein [Myxococcaceae bacterium]|nr:tetratricopeptide repeat protein [Myxococcaceae bacterium]
MGTGADSVKAYSAVLHKKPNDAEALAALEALLKDESVRAEAARALIPAYEAVKEHRKLVAALDLVAEMTQDQLERVLALQQAAHVHLHHLRQPELAFAALSRALRLSPADPNLRTAARRAAEDADAMDGFANVLKELVGRVDLDSPARVALHRELADVQEKKLDDRRGAIAQLESVLVIEPGNVDALRALQRLLRATDDWRRLVSVLDTLAGLVPDPAERLALWREMALLREGKLDDREGAAGAWRRVSEADPLNREAVSALDRLYTVLGKFESLAFALELRRAQEGQSPQGREATFRLAQLRREKLQDFGGALQLLGQVLSEDPGHTPTLDLLEAWARSHDPDSRSALETLDPVLARSGQHPRRVAIREARMADALTDEKIRLTQEVRSIQERDMGQPQRAFVSAGQAFAQNVDRPGAKADLERLARITGSYEELASVYEKVAAETRGPDPDKVSWLRRAAELREHLAQSEESIKDWQALLVEAPQDRQALDALGKLFEQTKNAKQLSDVTLRKAQLASDPHERRALLLKAGEALEAASDDARAIDAYKEALALRRGADGLEALDRLYARGKRFEEQADVLAQLAASTTGEVQKAKLLARAELLERERELPAAVEGYARLLAVAQTDSNAVAGLERLMELADVRPDAARLLEPVYRSLNDVRHLVDVLEIRLASASPQDRLPLLEEISNLRETLGQKDLAFAARVRAFGEMPESPEAREQLERLAAETGSFEELASAYQDQLERGVTNATSTELWRRLAVLWSERLDRLDLAIRAYEELARREPRNMAVLEALARIHTRSGDARELASVMKRMVMAEPSPPKQIDLLFRLGTLAEETLSDKQLAAQCYGEVLARKPDDEDAIKFLGKVLTESERWPELASLIVKEIELADSTGRHEEMYDLMVRLGRLRLARLRDPRGGLDIFEDVLRRKQGHAGAIGALEEMARSDSPLRGEAAEALEPIFTSGGDHLRLVQMLESRASTEPVAEERAALLRKVAKLYAGPMQNADLAFVSASRALRELPDEEASLTLTVTLSERATHGGEELASLLEEILPRASEDAAQVAILRALGRAQEKLGHRPEAVDAWRRVLEVVPSDGEAMGCLVRLYQAAGRAPELLEIYKRQLAISEEPAVRAALLFQIAGLQDAALHDTVGAMATLRRLLELKPDEAQALERLDALCEKQERWPELADVIGRRLALPGGDLDLDLRTRLAVVRETRLLDKYGALELYGEVLAAQPKHAGALAQLEAWAQREPQNKPLVEVLLAAYRTTGEQAKLAGLLEARVGASADPFERKRLLVELAGLHEQAHDPAGLFGALSRAFEEDPNDPALRARLGKAADGARTHEALARLYEEELPRIAETRDAAAVLLELGGLYEQHLANPARAIEVLERARELDAATSLPALTALARLYGQAGRSDRLVESLDELEKLTPDGNERVQILFRLGQVAQDELEDEARAADAFERLLAIDKTHLPAARLLESIYERSGTPDRLFNVLRIQRDLTSGPERERILAKMVKVSAEGLADLEASIELYSELFQKNPKSDQAFGALEQALEKAGRWEDLRVLLAGKIPQVAEPRELVRLNEKLGVVLYRRLGRAEEAIAPLRTALERDARNRNALETLRDIDEQLGRREELVAVLRRLIPLQEAPEGVKGLRIRLAEVLGEMGRREEALDAARRSLEIEPHAVPDLERVGKLFLGLRAFGDAVRTLELKAEVWQQLEEKDGVIAALCEIAELWIGQANKPELAAPILERVLEFDPANRSAYERVLSLRSEAGDWRAYAQAVDRYLPNLVTDEDKIKALRELGRIREQKLGQKDGAFLALCRALQLDASDDSLREDVERLAQETGSYEELAAVYEQVADELPKGPLAERLYLVLARVQDKNLDDPGEAEAALRKILEFDPTNASALDAMAQMFGRRGRDRELIVSLEQKIEAAPSLEARKTILREVSRIHLERLKDPEEAANALIRALELEPDVETLGVLAGLYRDQHMWGDLAATLVRTRDLLPTSEERAQLQNSVALVQEKEIGDEEAAIEAYREALALDPRNAEALGALERLYTKLDRPADLLAIYERQLELTEDYREKVKILFHSAAIWEDRYQNASNADACIDGVLALDPTNLQAIKALERLRRVEGRWEDLVGVLERHIHLATDAEEQADLMVEAGEVLRAHLHQTDKAADAFQAALGVFPGHTPALHALGTLYERSGNWPFALEMLHQEAEALGRDPRAVEVLHRMGKINEDMLQDLSSAKACYSEALRIDPEYLPSLQALRGIYELEQDWESYEQTLVAEAQATSEASAKALAYLAVGRYHSERREDADSAMQWYEEAIKLDPEQAEAALPLSDLYIARERWEPAEKMLEVVIRNLKGRLATEQDEAVEKDLCRQVYRMGYVQEKLGRRDRALAAYEEAYQLDSTYLPALEGYANLLVQSGRHDQALKVFQTILIHHREDLTDLEIVELYWQIGEVHIALKQHDRAQNHFEKALAIDPGHEPSLRSLIQLADGAGRWDRSAEYRQALVNVLEGDPKAEAALELGQIARDRLKDLHTAIDAYAQALRIRPQSLEVMDALYVLYRETRQPGKAAEVLETMLGQPELQADAQRAKRVWFALGESLRDELRDTDRAVEAFNAALDLDPLFIEAFSSIEAMLGAAKEWKQLEENYARMIQRLPKTDETESARMALWRTLGDLYLQVLKQPESALMAYKVSAAGLPEDAAVQETYADLLLQTSGNEEPAVQALRRALAHTQNPKKVASQLAELAARRKDYDGAWLAAQVVSGLLGDPGPAEKEIISKLGPYAKKRETPRATLNDRLWAQHLLHPKVRTPFAELMGLLFQGAGQLWAVPLAQAQLIPKKHRIDVATAQEYQIHHYRAVARLLGLEAVELFSPFLVATRDKLAKRSMEPAPDPLLGVEIIHSQPVCLKVGGKFFGDPQAKDTHAQLGRTLALLRPELVFASRFAPERLAAVFQGAVLLAGFQMRWTAPAPAIEAERGALESVMTEPFRAALARLVPEVLRRNDPDPVRDYLEGAELTGVRCALFTAGDLEAVKKLVQGETGSSYRVAGKVKIRELMTFAVSEDLAALRLAVGTNVEVPARK